jgi:EAL domain-containing protein (putative c-di-GMP-specific phosphodiesterase class I)/GGDEF domain-containing protein
MQRHPLSRSENARVAALRNLHLLDTAPSRAFDRITRLAGRLLRVPVSSISLVDSDRLYFKSRLGFDLVEAPRESAPCHWAIRSDQVYTVQDLLRDERFGDTPMVQHGGIRSYAGAPLVTRTGYSLGTLCVMDKHPRMFSDEEVEVLIDLAAMVMGQIELQNSIGRIHPVSGYPNEYQLIDDLHELSGSSPNSLRTVLLIELVDARHVSQGMRVLGANFIENLIHSSTEAIRSALTARSHLYHVGTTRCVVLLDEAHSMAWQEIAHQLDLNLRLPIDCEGIPIRADPAIGVYTFFPSQVTSRDVLRRLYSAVDDARGQVIQTASYDCSHDRIHARHFELLAGMADALQADDQLTLVFQPRVDLNGRLLGAEALLRWHHPRHGDISPAEFIPLIEKTAHIDALTQWVLDHVLAQVARWRDQGHDFKVSINVSAPNLEDADFASNVARLLAQHRVPPSAIELEFTESVLARDDSLVVEQLYALRDMGIDIAIDDFGTGYSSLAYLQRLPASVLKIDRTFIKNLPTNERDRKLVRAMITMAHDLGYKVVAEGIESAESVALLSDWACDEAQGYYFSRPLTVAGMQEWLPYLD